MQVRVRVTKRRTKLLYAPVFVVDYSHGELFNQFGERKAQRFQALMSGLARQNLSADRHFSPQKVALLPVLRPHSGITCDCGLKNWADKWD